MNALSVLKDHFMTICVGMIVFLSSFCWTGCMQLFAEIRLSFPSCFFFLEGRDKFCYQTK